MATETETAPENQFVLPASYAQQRLWFLDRLDPSSATYNVPSASRVRGPLDVAALQTAINQVIERHETLRTVFTEVDGVPQQVVTNSWPLTLEVTDLSDRSDAEDAAHRLAVECASKPFDLSGDRLLRVALLKVGGEDHILVLTLHHIVADAWAMGVLGRELNTLYAAAGAGQAAELPELEIQYGDFAAWQQEWMESGGLDDQLAYWMRALAGAPGVLELPTDHPRPSEQSFSGATIRRILPSELCKALTALSEREGATMFMTLLAAFIILLHRYSAQDDIAVATPVANRGRVELENLIGLFVNTLVMRGDLSGEPTFRELLHRVRETALGAFSNQDLPFERLVQELSPQRDRSRPPLAQVMFALVGGAPTGGGLPGLEQERVNTDRGTSKLDISLFAGEVPEGLRVSIEYCTALFESSTIERMLGHYEVLLEAVAADPDVRIDEVQILTDAERTLLLRDWNDTATEYPDRFAHELLTAQARRTPDSIAVQFGDEHLTYAELDTRSNQLANHLTSLGVEPDVLVGICVERSLDMAIGVLGILKAGGAYVPIDPAYPADRQAYMLANAEAPVVLTQDRVRARLASGDAIVVSLDGDWPAIAALSCDQPTVALEPQHLSYVIYTSGSTGKPKGVQLTQRSLLNLLCTMREAPGLSPDDVLLAITTLSFDIASLEVLLPLICGARLVIAPGEATADPEALIALLEHTGATALQATPTTWRMLVDGGWKGSPGLIGITGGEALQTVLSDALLARGVELWNGYGPSETTIYSTRARIERTGERITIGRPVANTKVYVLDARRQPVPIGVPGELWIAGTGVARGYRGNPDLTEERFLPDPFSAESGARMYGTGDLTRWLADSRVEYLGRIDHQVKIRGFRIEPGEIEAALREHPAVLQALVVAREDGGDRRLVAYLVGEGEMPVAAELRGRLQSSLPDFMIPSAFVPLQAFPLTPNGKIDRKALPAPDGLARASAEYEPPRTELERSLATIWEGLLGAERVGLHDDFFALGGHSLLATKLISRVREGVGAEVLLQSIFESPTLESFAAAVRACVESDSPQPANAPLQPRPREARSLAGSDEQVFHFPASHAQQRLWFLDSFEPDSPAYNVPLVVRLRGELSVPAIQHAFDALVTRHEALRTTFTLIDGAPQQIVRSPRSVALEVTELAGAPEAEQMARRIVDEEIARTFDLENGPLLRARLLRLGVDDHILIATMHHIVVDAWSIGVMNRELSEFYAAFLEDRAPELPELPLQYGDYAAWQREWMASGGLDEQVAYWREQLAGGPTLLELPTDHPRPLKQSFRGAIVRGLLPRETLDRLRAVGEREGSTLFMTVLTAFAALLSRYSGQEDVVVASPIANRDRSELEGLVGFFVNTLALRVDLDGDPSFEELLRRVRGMVLDGFANRHLQFEKLVEELNPERHLSHAPIAQVMFVLTEAVGEGSLELPGLERERVSMERESAKFDLSLFSVDQPDGLHLGIEYCTDLFDRTTIERMVDHFVMLLSAVSTDPGTAVSRVPLLTAAERELMGSWNATGDGVGGERRVHDLVSEQVARTPDTVAVSLAGDELTYAELDTRANQLARHLIELGVGPDVPVAVCLERSLELAVAVLGVMKAGGAYAPIDPGYPADRAEFMIVDSRAPVLLTQRRLLERLPALGATTVLLDGDWEQIAIHDPSPPSTTTTSDHLAYVIYTSGSTGRPKGVAMPHRPLVNLLAWQLESWSQPSAARTLQFAALSFDVAFQEMFSTWCAGGTLILLDEAVRLDPQALLAHIAEQQVERLFLPFVALQNLCEAAEYLDASIPTLREVLTAGEQLKATDAVRRFFERHPGCLLVNQYGPTESHVVTAFDLGSETGSWPPLPPIGRPITGAKIRLLDRHRQQVPIGVPGELYIGGVSLARGYLGRPELTAEKFIADPWSDGARIYRTGDLARYLPDGNISYLGRADDQAKIRGFRIEPGEIENALRDHPMITEALVVAHEDQRGERQLVAYLIVHDRKLSTTELREFLRRSLPEYMVPSAFVTLDAYPVSPNGKVDRRALPAPDDESRETAEYAAPTNDLEKTLVEIWQELLGVERIGIYDNFFDLGGHSLLAVRLFSEVERLVQVRLPLVAVFRTGTIHGLANELRQGGHEVDQATMLELRSEGVGPAIYCIGGVHVYQELADELSPDYRCYGMYLPSEQEQFERESGAAHTDEASVEQIAAQYVNMIRDHQPEGPYLVFGLCFGGVVAYEAARQLTAAGQEVSLLVLFDSVLAESVRSTVKLRVRRRIRRTRQALSDRVPESVNRRRGKLQRSEIDRMALARHRIYAKATRSYRPGPYDGPTMLVRPSSVVESYRQNLIDDTSGWGRHARDLRIFDAPGDHITHLRRPHVRAVADELRAPLERPLNTVG